MCHCATYFHGCQRRIQNPAKHRGWWFLQKKINDFQLSTILARSSILDICHNNFFRSNSVYPDAITYKTVITKSAGSLNTLPWDLNSLISIINGFIFFFDINIFLAFLGKWHRTIKQRHLNMYSAMLNCRRGDIFGKIPLAPPPPPPSLLITTYYHSPRFTFTKYTYQKGRLLQVKIRSIKLLRIKVNAKNRSLLI